MDAHKKIREFFQPALAWSFGCLGFSRTLMFFFCVLAISVFAFWKDDSLFLWAGLGILAAGLFLSFFSVEDAAADADKSAVDKEKIKLQLKKENEFYSFKVVDLLAVFLFFNYEKSVENNTKVFSVLLANSGNIPHPCLTPKHHSSVKISAC
jgi:hypothetical protein